jgi:hypothetical protein
MAVRRRPGRAGAVRGEGDRHLVHNHLIPKTAAPERILTGATALAEVPQANDEHPRVGGREEF